MAMSHVIRRAFDTGVPRMIRASPRILSGCTNIVQRETFANSKQQSFSTVADVTKRADDKMMKILKYKIKLAKLFESDIQVPKAPTGFPFEIRDIPGENIKLTREFCGEKIEIEMEIPCNPDDKNVVSDVDDESDDENSSADSSDEEEEPRKRSTSQQPYCPFTVKIIKADGRLSEEFNCRANADSISIRTIDFKGSAYVKGSTIDVSDHDDDMENFWKKNFLGIRGIDDSIGGFLLDCAIKKSRRDRVLHWEKIRKSLKE